MEIKELLTTKLSQAGGRLKVSSALNPILWLCALTTVPCITVLVLLPNISVWVGLFLSIFAVAPVITAIFGFLFLLFNDRDKLQSEDYQIRKSYLELIEQKGSPAIEAAYVEVVENPERVLLPPADEEEEKS